jgi:hypothetical protein
METLLEYIPELIWWWPMEMAEDDLAAELGDSDPAEEAFAPTLRSNPRSLPPALFLCPGERAPWVRVVTLKGSGRNH